MSLAQLTTLSSPLNVDQINHLQQLTQSLTAEQRAWVSGYLVGIGHAQPAAAAIPAAAVNQKLCILYGSQTGTARSVAEQMAAQATSRGINFELVSMADFSPKQLKSLTHVALLVSTHGEGDPPDDAEELYDFLHSKKAPKLPNLHFSVLAFGDSSYEYFCKTGEDFQAQLIACGATEMHPLVKLDLDYQQDAARWNDDVLIQVESQLKTDSANVVALHSNELTPTVTPYNRENPFAATVLANQKITGRKSEKDIRHLEFDLAGSGIHYQAGDALGVWFTNDRELVNALITILKLDPTSEVATSKGKAPLSQALEEDLELTLLHPGFVQKYAEYSRDPQLLALCNDKTALRDFVAKRQVIDVVQAYPATLSAQDFVDCLRGLTPRMYSIASSLSELEDEVHLTVAVVRYDAFDQLHLGGASGYLGERIQEGDKVNVFVEPNHNFKLPAEVDKPIIMIGPGTGIAPFRAFVQERAAQSAQGKNWLFFGNPHSTEDFLYQTEWQRYLKQGVLTHLDLAFSRDQAEKIYVQDRLLEQAEKVWQWIQEGAYLYVCGDASRMAKDVHNALVQIIQRGGDMGIDDAEAYLTQLRKAKRYQKDVY